MASSLTSYKRITNWNTEIIQPINELAINPPGDCDILTTLPEAEEHHKFTRQDVLDVHAKLEEICPNNDFTPLVTHQRITEDLITEIESAIATGWCDECAEDDEITADEWSLGNWVVQKAYGTNSSTQCCGAEVEYKDFLAAYVGYNVIIFESSYYNVGQYTASNATNWSIAQSTYITARNNGVWWAGSREIELLQQRAVEQLTEELQTLNATLVTLQQLLALGEDVQSQIDSVTQEIAVVEDQLDQARTARDEARVEAESYLSAADAAATQNWAALASLRSWDPYQINIVSDLIINISEPWGLGKYPFNYSPAFWGVGFIKTSSTGPTMFGRFTPSGLPYSKNGPMIWGADWWERRQRSHCNGIWDVWAGLGALGECSDFVPFEQPSSLPSTQVVGDQLELIIGVTHGTQPADAYTP